MPIRKYKPTSPGRRQMSVSGFDEITKIDAREVVCSSHSRSTAGRNNIGRITTRHRGGGAKRFYRIDRLQAEQVFGSGKGGEHRV